MRQTVYLWCALTLGAAGSCLDAQVLYGTLLGNVVDPSQSAVPKAVVTATNKSTGLVRETVSDERGLVVGARAGVSVIAF